MCKDRHKVIFRKENISGNNDAKGKANITIKFYEFYESTQLLVRLVEMLGFIDDFMVHTR